MNAPASSGYPPPPPMPLFPPTYPPPPSLRPGQETVGNIPPFPVGAPRSYHQYPPPPPGPVAPPQIMPPMPPPPLMMMPPNSLPLPPMPSYPLMFPGTPTVDFPSMYATDLLEHLKADGTFDRLRRDCIADIDTKPAFQNLLGRVERRTTEWLDKQGWPPAESKAQVRESLRKELMGSIGSPSSLSDGIERALDQALNAATVSKVIGPVVESAVAEALCLSFKSNNLQQQKALDDIHNYFSEFMPKLMHSSSASPFSSPAKGSSSTPATTSPTNESAKRDRDRNRVRDREAPVKSNAKADFGHNI